MSSATNRWKGFVAGMLGSVAGLLALRHYWARAAPIMQSVLEPGQHKAAGLLERGERARALVPALHAMYDDVSIPGRQYQEGESSTDALGRMLFRAATGRPPRAEETRMRLSQPVHWGYGMLQGGMYGAARATARGLDLGGGVVFGAGLWLVGDELVVPLLGLQGGPATVPPVQHINRLGAHLAYGAATAGTAQILRRLL
jgi:hypothetical protein